MMNIIDEDTKVMEQVDVPENSNDFGDHPIGTLIGAAAGAGAATLTGAALGGPAGAVAGAIFGAVAGGIAGNDVAEAVDPKVDGYWQEHYGNKSYVNPDRPYEDYRSAYNFGYNQRNANLNGKFSEYEEDFRNKWNESEAAKKMDWNDAKEAARDSYELEEAVYDAASDSYVVRPLKKSSN